jgi:hypothetical protein
MDEQMSHEEMLAFVENVIANRKRVEATNGKT